jgi:hypothetical protein
MLPLTLLTSPPAAAQISIGISVNIAPPILPVYVQPVLPAPGYIWTPGYWAWNPDAADYYWVPGTWVLPPQDGVLWTPGYWGWTNGAYLFHVGYWGPTIGFYGGVNYGFGYTGSGFLGGQWRNGQYYYNSSVSNVKNVNVTNVYNKQVTVNNTTNVSYNGGAGGTTAKATPEELAAEKEPHIAPTTEQVHHADVAKADPANRFSNNHGKPATAAVSKPLTSTGAPKEGGANANEEKAKEKAEPKKEHAEPKKELAEPKKEPVAPKKEAVELKKPVSHPAPHPHPAARPAPHPHPAPRAAPCKGEHCH